MNTNQVIEGIGKAVAATMPAQEYCLFWWEWWPMCMTKGEWSSWVQAMFSVVAIFSAVAIAWGQNYIERKKTLRNDLDAAYITALEVVLFLKPIYTRLHFFLETRNLDGTDELKEFWLQCVLDDINSAATPSEGQLLRLMAIPGSCALDISRGFGLMKQVQQYLIFKFSNDIKMKEGGMVLIYKKAVLDLTLSKNALEQGEKELMSYFNHSYIPKKISITNNL